MDNAEKVMQSNADSALSILDLIDPSELKADSLRAKYHYLMAYGHMRCDRDRKSTRLTEVQTRALPI